MKPLRNNVFVGQKEVETTTASGIVLAGSVETGVKPAVVLAVGPGVVDVKVGDVCVVKWDKATAVTHNGEQGAVISEEFIEAIL